MSFLRPACEPATSFWFGNGRLLCALVPGRDSVRPPQRRPKCTVAWPPAFCHLPATAARCRERTCTRGGECKRLLATVEKSSVRKSGPRIPAGKGLVSL